MFFSSGFVRFTHVAARFSFIAHPTSLLICKNRKTGGIFWRSLPAKVCPRSWSQSFFSVRDLFCPCGEVCGERSAKFRFLLFPSLEKSSKFPHKFHHVPRPQTEKIPLRGTISPPSTFIPSVKTKFGLPNFGISILNHFDAMQFRRVCFPYLSLVTLSGCRDCDF